MSTGFGIYVHTPWCRTRCPYCAFNVFLSDTADYDRWKQGALAAWSAVSDKFPGGAHSLYFGGGTPSLAPPDVLGALIDELPLQPNAEVTLEANPGSVDSAGLRAFHDVGINRLSIGVQTFDPNHARKLGRGHTVNQAQSLLSDAHTLGFDSWSMDLMFALSEQSETELNRDLDILMGIAPPHVSLYGLSIEPGTPFERAQKAGTLHLPETDSWRRMYDRIVSVLEHGGLERYEVSNFAQQGHRGVHNEHVWRGGHYAGLGPGAHGFLPDGTRTLGHSSLEDWFDNPVAQESVPSALDAAVDYILSTLRHAAGTDRTVLRARSGYDLSDDDVQAFINQEMIVSFDDHIALIPSAFPVADGIIRKLIRGLQVVHPLDGRAP
jgi:putative oxygen-independent coproporphyrinogen III oxidase